MTLPVGAGMGGGGKKKSKHARGSEKKKKNLNFNLICILFQNITESKYMQFWNFIPALA